jgi:hypothetical protein
VSAGYSLVPEVVTSKSTYVAIAVAAVTNPETTTTSDQPASTEPAPRKYIPDMNMITLITRVLEISRKGR